MSEFQEKMRHLITTHCETLREEYGPVRDLLTRLRDPDRDPAGAITEGVGRVHKIKGSSGSIGFHAVSAIAQELETQLSGLDCIGAGPEASGIARALALGAELDRQIAALRPEQSALYDVD